MKRVVTLCLSIFVIMCVLCACVQQTEGKNTTVDSTQEETIVPQNNYFNTEIKESPDKYTWYIRNYVGRNCATIGYFTVGGFLNESYGEGSIKIIIIAEDGSYVDSETLKDYVVVEQSVAPNTELKYVFHEDEKYSNLVVSQNIEEIEVLVRKVGTK